MDSLRPGVRSEHPDVRLEVPSRHVDAAMTIADYPLIDEEAFYVALFRLLHRAEPSHS